MFFFFMWVCGGGKGRIGNEKDGWVEWLVSWGVVVCVARANAFDATFCAEVMGKE